MMNRNIKLGLAVVMLLVAVFSTFAVALSAGALNLGSTAANPTQKVKVETTGAIVGQRADATVVATSTAAAQQSQAPLPVLDARGAVKVAGPAVVTIVNTQATQSGRFRGGTLVASGSGVIIDRQGYIITNNHVVEGEQSLEVIFADGSKTTAQLVGTDSFADLAVLKVSVPVPAVAEFADSGALEPGQPVVAIGSPLGDYPNTVTVGVVSGLHRSIADSGSPALQDLVQTDAAINHGNSGGALVDLNGRIIGINVAVIRETGTSGDVAEGIGFAIPSNTARDVSNQIISKGSVSRPYIGISYQLITPQVATANNLARQNGLYVSSVEAGSPADKAGIKANSIITRFDGTEITSETSLPSLLMAHKVGDSVKLGVLAPGATNETEVTVVLGQRPGN
ncbi:MAG TPA: trypsin-like peptidase domain-containing protein [Chloroflexia bacterium]|nr:trypsin-like peptidase domain-containing protein [Chloroflexia bacterium]